MAVVDSVAATMASPCCCWSSLPADLVNRVADCLLATNDIDYYADLRAVCHHWRSSTADPRINPLDPRFHTTRWIMLDDHKFSSSSSIASLFVNTSTGRFLRKRLQPLLRDYDLFTSTVGGFLVLLDTEPPHAVSVLNPFTGSIIRFKARVPFEMSMTANVVAPVGDDARQLVLVLTAPAWRCPADQLRFYLADPDSERFSFRTTADPSSDASSAGDPVTPPLLLVPSNAVQVVLDLDPSGAGEILLVDRPLQDQGEGGGRGVFLFRMDDSTGRATGERLRSIGSRALFVGTTRCFSVDAGSFPSVGANCNYHHNGGSTMGDCFPVPIIELLMEYTVQYCPRPRCFFRPSFMQQATRSLCDIYFKNPMVDDD